MTFKDMLPSFAFELEKLATPNYAKKVDTHHKADEKDWGAFERNLKRSGFRAAVLAHPESDAKLKRYTKAMGAYSDSKDVAGVVPSRTEQGKLHTIKKLKDGRLGCGCKDWRYVHSHRGTDCAHIQELKPNLEKTSTIAGGIRGSGVVTRSGSQWARGKAMKENVERLHRGEPLIAVPKKGLL